jgi:hypothetical protein
VRRSSGGIADIFWDILCDPIDDGDAMTDLGAVPAFSSPIADRARWLVAAVEAADQQVA